MRGTFRLSSSTRDDDGQPWAGFAETFTRGTSIALVGGKGSGKSWTASYLAQLGLDRRDYLVASNILCQRWVPALDDPKSGTWAEAYPPGYQKVNTYYRLFWVIESALRSDRTVLFMLDEAGATAHGLQAGETVLQQHVRDNLAFMALARHLNVSTVIIAQSLEQVVPRLRTQEQRIIDHVFTKPSRTQKDLLLVENVDGLVIPISIPAYGLAHTKSWAMKKPGRIIYADSMSRFDVGVYPGTSIPFRLRELIDALSDQLPARYPEIIREHLEWRPRVLPVESPVAAPEDSLPGDDGEGLGRQTPRRSSPEQLIECHRLVNDQHQSTRKVGDLLGMEHDDVARHLELPGKRRCASRCAGMVARGLARGSGGSIIHVQGGS